MIFKWNNKGFTMVELLVAMAIMGLLIIMAFPTIRAIQANNQETKYQNYGDAAISAAKIYTDSYAEDMFVPGVANQFKQIKFEDLIKKDLLKDINISDSSCVDKSYVVVVKYKDDYAYCLHLECMPKNNPTGKSLYTETNRKGSCTKYSTTKVKYMYGTTVYKEDEVIAGDDEYIVKHPSANLNSFLKTNHLQFDNWKYNNTSQNYSPGNKLPPVENEVILSVNSHKYKYTVKYSSSMDGVSGSIGNTPCTYGSNCVLNPNSFTKDYYSFTNWKYNSLSIANNSNLQTDYIAKGKLDITSDGQVLNLSAQWRKNQVKVKYNSNGGSLANPHSSEITLNGSKVLVNKNEIHHTINYDSKLSNDGLINWNNSGYLNLIKTGYTVKAGEEWNTASNGTGTTFNQTKAYTAQELCKTLKTGDCIQTMHTKWIPKTIQVTFNCNGGTGGTSQSFTYGVSGQKFNTSATTCTNAENNLIGWKKDKNKTTQAYSFTNGVADSWIDSNFPSITLYAHWDPKSYTCPAGKYLPKNKTTCESCTSGNYCLGGTWKKSTTADQGLTPCPSGYNKSATGSTKDTQCYMEVSKNKYVKTAKDSSATACASGYEKEAHNVYYGNTSVCVSSCGAPNIKAKIIKVTEDPENDGSCKCNPEHKGPTWGMNVDFRFEYTTAGACENGLKGTMCYQQSQWTAGGYEPGKIDCDFLQIDYPPNPNSRHNTSDGAGYSSWNRPSGHYCFKSMHEWYYYRSINCVWVKVCNKVGNEDKCESRSDCTWYWM